MSYFFPGILESIDFKNAPLAKLKYNVNSGENAIRLLLRSYQLPVNSNVALPAFVCNSVLNAVLAENLNPIFVDFKNTDDFWTEFKPSLLLEKNIKALILVHYYGLAHPDTIEISQFCNKHNIYLIHDAAQSYGIDERLLKNGSGTVYSFGPGKSSTAAEGAFIDKVDEHFYFANVVNVNNNPIRNWALNQRAKNFIQSRKYNHKFTKIQLIERKVAANIVKMFDAKQIFDMTTYQLKAASETISRLKSVAVERRKRFNSLKESFVNHNFLKLVNDVESDYSFKVILKLLGEKKAFVNFLKNNNAPFFCLYDTIDRKKNESELVNYAKLAPNLIEISIEASIPMDEIKRVAEILKNYS